MFLRNINMALLPTVISDAIADSFYTVLKQDTLRRIISIINNMLSVEMEKEQTEVDSQQDAKASAIRYAINEIIKGLVRIVRKIGGFR